MTGFFVLMIRRTPRSTRTDTLFPYTTLFRAREATVLEGFAEEEAAKALILVDLIRCTPTQVARRAAAMIKTFYDHLRSEAHTSELPSLMRISYAVFCLNKINIISTTHIAILVAPITP